MSYIETIGRRMAQQRQFEDDTDRLECIKRAWEYYEGKHPEMLLVRPGAPNDNVVINLAREIVDKGVSFLFGGGVEWQFDETDASTTPAEEAIGEVWDANQKNILLHEVGQNGSMAGIAAIKIAPRDDGSIRLVNLNPAELQLFHAPDDCEDITEYRIRYTATVDGNEIQFMERITRNGAAWRITKYRALGSARSYTQDGPPIDWPYPLAPVQHCKNWPRANCPYGYGDLEDMSLQDALNLTASATRKTLRLFPDPQDVLFGASARGLVRGGDNVWGDLPATARLERFEYSADALAASRQHYIDLRSAIFSGARMPDMASMADRLGNVTNFGLRVLYKDLLDKTATKRILYGGLINRVNKVLALILDLGEVETSFTWPDPLPVNELEQVQAVTQKKATGLVSNETLTQEMGYDYDDEQARIVAERAAQPPQVDALGGDPLLPGQQGATAEPQGVDRAAQMG